MDEAEKFWEFAVSVYDRVREPCLVLQDEHGFEVNLLLFCCWQGTRGIALDDAGIARIVEACADWSGNVVEPLRRSRRWLRERRHPPGAPDLRKRIAGLELEGERLLQTLILEACGPVPFRQGEHDIGGRHVAEANLEVYRRLALRAATADVEPLIESLLAGVFAEASADDMVMSAEHREESKKQ